MVGRDEAPPEPPSSGWRAPSPSYVRSDAGALDASARRRWQQRQWNGPPLPAEVPRRRQSPGDCQPPQNGGWRRRKPDIPSSKWTRRSEWDVDVPAWDKGPGRWDEVPGVRRPPPPRAYGPIDSSDSDRRPSGTHQRGRPRPDSVYPPYDHPGWRSGPIAPPYEDHGPLDHQPPVGCCSRSEYDDRWYPRPPAPPYGAPSGVKPGPPSHCMDVRRELQTSWSDGPRGGDCDGPLAPSLRCLEPYGLGPRDDGSVPMERIPRRRLPPPRPLSRDASLGGFDEGSTPRPYYYHNPTRGLPSEYPQDRLVSRQQRAWKRQECRQLSTGRHQRKRRREGDSPDHRHYRHSHRETDMSCPRDSRPTLGPSRSSAHPPADVSSSSSSSTPQSGGPDNAAASSSSNDSLPLPHRSDSGSSATSRAPHTSSRFAIPIADPSPRGDPSDAPAHLQPSLALRGPPEPDESQRLDKMDIVNETVPLQSETERQSNVEVHAPAQQRESHDTERSNESAPHVTESLSSQSSTSHDDALHVGAQISSDSRAFPPERDAPRPTRVGRQRSKRPSILLEDSDAESIPQPVNNDAVQQPHSDFGDDGHHAAVAAQPNAIACDPAPVKKAPSLPQHDAASSACTTPVRCLEAVGAVAMVSRVHSDDETDPSTAPPSSKDGFLGRSKRRNPRVVDSGSEEDDDSLQPCSRDAREIHLKDDGCRVPAMDQHGMTPIEPPPLLQSHPTPAVGPSASVHQEVETSTDVIPRKRPTGRMDSDVRKAVDVAHQEDRHQNRRRKYPLGLTVLSKRIKAPTAPRCRDDIQHPLEQKSRRVSADGPQPELPGNDKIPKHRPVPGDRMVKVDEAGPRRSIVPPPGSSGGSSSRVQDTSGSTQRPRHDHVSRPPIRHHHHHHNTDAKAPPAEESSFPSAVPKATASRVAAPKEAAPKGTRDAEMCPRKQHQDAQTKGPTASIAMKGDDAPIPKTRGVKVMPPEGGGRGGVTTIHRPLRAVLVGNASQDGDHHQQTELGVEEEEGPRAMMKDIPRGFGSLKLEPDPTETGQQQRAAAPIKGSVPSPISQLGDEKIPKQRRPSPPSSPSDSGRCGSVAPSADAAARGEEHKVPKSSDEASQCTSLMPPRTEHQQPSPPRPPADPSQLPCSDVPGGSSEQHQPSGDGVPEHPPQDANQTAEESLVAEDDGQRPKLRKSSSGDKFSRELCSLYEHLIESGASRLLAVGDDNDQDAQLPRHPRRRTTGGSTGRKSIEVTTTVVQRKPSDETRRRKRRLSSDDTMSTDLSSPQQPPTHHHLRPPPPAASSPRIAAGSVSPPPPDGKIPTGGATGKSPRRPVAKTSSSSSSSSSSRGRRVVVVMDDTSPSGPDTNDAAPPSANQVVAHPTCQNNRHDNDNDETCLWDIDRYTVAVEEEYLYSRFMMTLTPASSERQRLTQLAAMILRGQ